MSTTIKYTSQQQHAITARGVSLSLAAGAGCGKTFVLTERFIAELDAVGQVAPDERLSQLVAITFTDAAARELRTRIRKLVVDRIATTPADQRGYWQQLGRAIDACRISTIHSLCGNLLREHAFDVGLDPLFTTLDASAAAVLEAEVIEDTLRELLTARDEPAMAIARAWGIERAKTAITGLMASYRSPGFTEWLQRKPEDLIAAWQNYYDAAVWPVIQQSVQPLAVELCELLTHITPANSREHQKRQELVDGLEALTAGQLSLDQLIALRQLARANCRPFSKNCWDSAERFECYKGCVKKLRDRVDKLPKFDLASESATQASELGIAVAQVANAAATRYQETKDQRGALDFDDLLTKTHQLLTDPAHRALQQRLQEGIGVLFVDEFQDTDLQQADMVRALVGDIVESGKLFFVGDDKQSIYRFRGAEPQVFRDLRNQIDEKWRLPLSKNFRSQPAILKFANTLFGRVFAEYQSLEPSRKQVTPEPAVEFLWTEVPKPSAKPKGHAATARKAEARAIAQRLRQLVDEGPPIIADTKEPEGCRRARYSDVAILFRVLSDVAYYEEALRAQGIDYYLVGGHAFYTQQEVYDVLHLLRVVASECDELSLAGVLRSPFFALADETLFWLGTKCKSLERGLFSASLPSEIDATERAKVVAAAATIADLRQSRHSLSVPQLLTRAMQRTGYDAALLADFMGERKLANVYKLIEQARTAVASGVGSLDDFVTQLATFATRSPKEALATTSPDTANVVRLMTVHKAKGLEFPLVVVPDLDRKAQANRDAVAYDERLGPLVGAPEQFDGQTSGLKLYKHVESQAEREESDRLFYVACTRAADYLLLSSSISDLQKPVGPWLKRLAESFDCQTGDLLDASVADPPQVRAALLPPPKPMLRTGGASANWFKLIEQTKRETVDPEVERSAAAIAVDLTTRRRFSVTRLSGQIVPAGGDWWRDEPAAEIEPAAADQVDPLGFGTLVHAVLERVHLGDRATIATWARALAPQHDLLHAAAAEQNAKELLERFVTSSRADDLRSARQVHHELEFNLAWPVGTRETNARYLQGYLDCMYQGEDGRWRVIDYKTNQVTPAGVSKLAKKYELQMLVYGLAVEQAWGTGPDELVLHFLRPGVEHVFRWNAEMRQRAIELVAAAMQELVGN